VSRGSGRRPTSKWATARTTADGWYTAYTHDGDEKLTILAFGNMGGYSLGDLENRLFLIAVGWPPQRAAVSSDVLDRYTGRYTWWDGYRNRKVTAIVERGADDTLVFTSDRYASQRLRNARVRITLAPMSDDTFFATGDQLWSGTVVAFEHGDALVLANRHFGWHDRYRRA
jgi:hypothetical protein